MHGFWYLQGHPGTNPPWIPRDNLTFFISSVYQAGDLQMSPSFGYCRSSLSLLTLTSLLVLTFHSDSSRHMTQPHLSFPQ
jgi:hypothetical protein